MAPTANSGRKYGLEMHILRKKEEDAELAETRIS
jgi:hypothetical protein